MIQKFILSLSGFMLLTSLAVAAPVKIPTGKEGNSVLTDFADGKFRVSTGVEYDSVFERKLDVGDSEVDFGVISAEIALEYDNNTKGYVTVGQARDIGFKEVDGADFVKINFEDSLIFGVGLTGKSSTLLGFADIFTDISYRQTTEMDYESVDFSLLGVSGNFPKQAGVNSDADWKEWQLALGISKDFEYFLPYAGVRYSDVETSLKVAVPSLSVEWESTANSDKKVGLFVGTMFFPTQSININVQGRFIDEQALTVSAAWIF